MAISGDHDDVMKVGTTKYGRYDERGWTGRCHLSQSASVSDDKWQYDVGVDGVLLVGRIGIPGEPEWSRVGFFDKLI